MDPPFGKVPEQVPDWFLVSTEACGGGTPDLFCPLMFLGYMDIYIYRRKKSVRGATRGPRVWRARPLPHAFLVAFLPWTPSLPGCFLSKNNFSRRFHSVSTPFDIPFLRNTETREKTGTGTGLWVNRLVPKNNIKVHSKAHKTSKMDNIIA